MSSFNLGSNFSGVGAPDFPDGLIWFNSDPLNLRMLKGQVVLVDFWTYSCINCQRTLPYLKKWWEKYKNSGLIIVGVHTPEFEFEKDIDNVKNSLRQYEIDWPVVLDNDYKIWNSYANHYWPAKYLINTQGKIIYSHFGEGNYLETELEIQKTLIDAGFKVSDTTVGKLIEEQAQRGQTPELYFGQLRGHILQVPKGAFAQQLQADQIYTAGNWLQQKEYLEHPSETKDLEDLIILKYRSKKVYLVMESSSNRLVKVYITLDGVPVDTTTAGRDVKFDLRKRAYVDVQFSTLYNLIETKQFGEHILRISTLEKGVRLFAFTFGS